MSKSAARAPVHNSAHNSTHDSIRDSTGDSAGDSLAVPLRKKVLAKGRALSKSAARAPAHNSARDSTRDSTHDSEGDSLAVPLRKKTLRLEFDNHDRLQVLCGARDRHLETLESKAKVTILARGNVLTISGRPEPVGHVGDVLRHLYQNLCDGQDIDMARIDRVFHGDGVPNSGSRADPLIHPLLHIGRRPIIPRCHRQHEYLDMLRRHPVVFAIGPAGTGKTYLAVMHAVSLFLAGAIDTIILTRPAVEAGEKLGFLPGDMKEKVDPYLRPLYDALRDALPQDRVMRLIERGDIEIAPLAFMRGRTLKNACVIFDEAQNATGKQLKMLLTRLGENCRVVITGDPSQADLDTGDALSDAARILDTIEGITAIHFTDADIVRHSLVQKIVLAYDAFAKKRQRMQSRTKETLR